MSRGAEAFGPATGYFGIVIALAVAIGKCMMDSGAADRIVRAFLIVLGKRRVSFVLMSSGFVLSIPVFSARLSSLTFPSVVLPTNDQKPLCPIHRCHCRWSCGDALTRPTSPLPLLMAQKMRTDDWHMDERQRILNRRPNDQAQY